MRYRISVSKIDQLRSYMDEEYNTTQQDVIDYLKGTKAFTPAMTLGTAFHSLVEMNHRDVEICEDPKHGTIFKVKVPELQYPMTFTAGQAKPAVEFAAAHRGAIYETPVEKEVHISGVDVLITGRVDMIEGRSGRDIKTGKYNLDVDQRYRSSQWRFYTWILGLKDFHYDNFRLLLADSNAGPIMIGSEYESVSFDTYDGIEADCLRYLASLIDFARMHDLMSYLEEKKK